MAKAVANSLTKKRRRVSDIVLKALIFLSSGIVVALTLGMIIYIAVKGTDGMSLNFLTTPAFSYPYENYGVLGNIINTLYLVVITLIIATPVGVGAAIYLTEYAKQGRFTRIIEFTTETLAGIPSIIYGLFGSVFFYNIFKVNYSLLTGALTLSIMVLPTIIRTTQEAIKTVPMGYREGAVGLGAPKWHTIRTVHRQNSRRVCGTYLHSRYCGRGRYKFARRYFRQSNESGRLAHGSALPVRTAWRCRNEVRILYSACTACNSAYNQYMRKASRLQNKKETFGINP